MLPEMTPAVARALQSAHVYAAAERKAELEPLHLLVGLLEEAEGRAALLAAAAGFDAVRFQTAQLFAGQPGAKAEEPALPIAPAT